MELDAKDKRILFELDNDATIGLKDLAKKLRASKEVVAYRIRQLEEKGIISRYMAISHATKLGLTYYKLFIKYSHIIEEKKKEVRDFIMREKGLAWLASTEGSFDLVISIKFHSVFEFEGFKDELCMRFDSIFQRTFFDVMTYGEGYPRQYILGKSNPARKVFVFVDAVDAERVDREDLAIIQAISKNSRASSMEIAKATGLTDRIVRYRRAQLEKRGLIVGYKIAINYRKLNYFFFKCLIKFQSANAKRLNDLKLYARQHPCAVHWLKVMGEWDLELEIEAPSIEEFYHISNEIREKFSYII